MRKLHLLTKKLPKRAIRSVQKLLTILFASIHVLLSRKQKVLYISGCPGGSMFYRCTNQKIELNRFGISASVVSANAPILNILVNKHEVFVFQRVIWSKKIEKILFTIKQQNKIAIYETDDLIFDPEHAVHLSMFDKMGSKEQSWYRNGIGRELLEDQYVAHVIVSTTYLKSAMLLKYPYKKVFISSNKLNSDQVANANAALQLKEVLIARDDKIRIGYFSGSASHDKDFETVSHVLREIMRENTNVVLMIVGPLNMSSIFDDLQEQLERFNFVSLAQLPKLILRCDINIAPLEINNPFCQAKSAIKYLEASLLKIPTVATATTPFCQAITHAKDGFLAVSEDEWKHHLITLIRNANLRTAIGESAYRTVMANHTIDNLHSPSELIQFLSRA